MKLEVIHCQERRKINTHIRYYIFNSIAYGIRYLREIIITGIE